MKGFNILYVAMWRILSNLNVAFRVSIVWLTVSAIVVGYFGIQYFSVVSSLTSDTESISSFTSSFPMIFVIVFVLAMIGGSIIAIGWHRFCILGEDDGGFNFWPKKGLLWLYIKAVLALFFVSLLVLIPVMIVFLPLIGATVLPTGEETMTFHIVNAVFSVVLGAIIAGISLFLPAAAVGRPIRFSKVMGLIKSQFLVLLSLSFAYYLLELAVSFVGTSLGFANLSLEFGLGTILVLVVIVLAGWFLFMLSIGYISELYGTLLIDETGEEGARTTPQPGQ